MKVNVDQQIPDLDGKPVLTTNRSGETEVLTLGTVCTTALCDPKKLDPGATGDQMIDRFELAQKIRKGGVIELVSEQICDLKKLARLYYGNVVFARTCKLLEKESSGQEK